MSMTTDKQPIRPNFQNLPFWNPTKIYDHEVDKNIHRMDLNETFRLLQNNCFKFHPAKNEIIIQKQNFPQNNEGSYDDR